MPTAPNLQKLIEQSVHLELRVSELYFFLYRQFPDDAEFWWKLVEEENNHAALLRSGQEYFEPAEKFPPSILHTNIDTLIATSNKLTSLLASWETTPPSREIAFNTALVIEACAGELHFQQFMESDTHTTKIETVFRQLNGDDIHHAKRILEYMQHHGIPADHHTTL